MLGIVGTESFLSLYLCSGVSWCPVRNMYLEMESSGAPIPNSRARLRVWMIAAPSASVPWT